MSAGENLSSDQFHFRLHSSNTQGGYTTRSVTAHEQGEDQEIGHLAWTDYPSGPTIHGEIQAVWTHPAHRRKGVATGMWAAARAYADLHDIVAPRHSEERTYAGDVWAHSVSPKRSIPE